MAAPSTPGPRRYVVVFEGRYVPGCVAADVQAAFSRKFGPTAAKRVFSAPPVVLKRKLDRQSADKLQRKYHMLGLVTRISKMKVAAPEQVREPEPAEVLELSLVDDEPATADAETAERAGGETGVIYKRPVAAGEKPANTISPAEIDASYVAEPGKPAGVSTSYRVHLGIVATLMILLPVLYLLFAAGTAYATYWHATNNFDMVRGYLTALGYGVPILGGGLLSLFFFKPFVSGTSVHEPQPVRLDPMKEPAIFHLVERITNSLDAPMPEEILVDAEVNASASLRHGVFSRKLTLTIGMPLFYGLTVEQLSGVLAHEFGHFAQSYGMRFAAIIHHINHWFYQQAYEDDGWDDMIESWGNSNIAIFSLSAAVAQLGALLVRLLLMALAVVATMLSRGLSRHMEFDADRYQVEFTGSDAYPDLAHAMRQLAAGHEIAIGLAAHGLDEERLPDDLPALLVEIAAGFDLETRNAIIADIQKVNDSVFDTHPPDIERIMAADRLDKPGVFRNARPAHELVREAKRLGRHVTLQWYRAHGLEIAPTDLMPNDRFMQTIPTT